MNTYIFIGGMVVLSVLNFVAGGNVWTFGLIWLSMGWASHDAKMDAQTQIDMLTEMIRKKFNIDDKELK